jgi:hypothetical protein
VDEEAGVGGGGTGACAGSGAVGDTFVPGAVGALETGCAGVIC